MTMILASLWPIDNRRLILSEALKSGLFRVASLIFVFGAEFLAAGLLLGARQPVIRKANQYSESSHRHGYPVLPDCLDLLDKTQTGNR